MVENQKFCELIGIYSKTKTFLETVLFNYFISQLSQRVRWFAGVLILSFLSASAAGADFMLAQRSSSPAEMLEKMLDDAQKSAEKCQKRPTCRHYKMGRLFYNSKRYQEAISEFDKVIELDQSFDVAYIMRGMALTHVGKAHEAVAQIDRGIAVARKEQRRREGWYWWPYFHKGAALMMLPNPPEARVAFTASLRARPDASTYEARARAYAVERKFAHANADLDQAIKLKPKSARLWSLKSQVSYMAGSANQSCQAARRACTLGDCRILRQVPNCKQ